MYSTVLEKIYSGDNGSAESEEEVEIIIVAHAWLDRGLDWDGNSGTGKEEINAAGRMDRSW